MLFIFLFATLAGVFFTSPDVKNVMNAILQTIAGPMDPFAANHSPVLPMVTSSAASMFTSSTTNVTLATSTITRNVHFITTIYVNATASKSENVTSVETNMILPDIADILQLIFASVPYLLAFIGLSFIVMHLLLAFRFTGSGLIHRLRSIVKEFDLVYHPTAEIIQGSTVGTPMIDYSNQVPALNMLDRLANKIRTQPTSLMPWSELMGKIENIYAECRLNVMQEWQEAIELITQNKTHSLPSHVDGLIMAQLLQATDAYISIRTKETHVPIQEYISLKDLCEKQHADLSKEVEKANTMKMRALMKLSSVQPKLDAHDRLLDLETRYETLNDMNRAIENDIENLLKKEPEIKAYKDAIIKYQDAKAKYEDAKAKCEEAQAKYKEFEAKYYEAITEGEDTKAKFEDAQAKHEDSEARHKETQAKHDELMAKYEDAKAKHENSKVKYEDAQARLEASEAKHKETKAQYDEAVNEGEQAKATHKDLNAKLKQVKLDLKKLREEKFNMINAKNELAKANTEAKERCEELEDEVHALKSSIDKLQDDFTKLNQQTAKAQIAQAQAETKASDTSENAENTVQKLSTEVNLLRAFNQRLMGQGVELQARYDELDQDGSALEDENLDLKEENDNLREQNDNLREENGNLREQITELEQHIQEESGENYEEDYRRSERFLEKTKGTLKTVRVQCTKLETELAQLKAAHEKLNQEHCQCEESKQQELSRVWDSVAEAETEEEGNEKRFVERLEKLVKEGLLTSLDGFEEDVRRLAAGKSSKGASDDAV